MVTMVISELKSISRLKIFRETGPRSNVSFCDFWLGALAPHQLALIEAIFNDDLSNSPFATSCATCQLTERKHMLEFVLCNR